MFRICQRGFLNQGSEVRLHYGQLLLAYTLCFLQLIVTNLAPNNQVLKHERIPVYGEQKANLKYIIFSALKHKLGGGYFLAPREN